MSNDITNVCSDNITTKTLNQKENTKEQLGVVTLIAIMEPATKSQSFRAYKLPLRSRPSNKIIGLRVQWRPFFPTKRKRQTLYLPD